MRFRWTILASLVLGLLGSSARAHVGHLTRLEFDTMFLHRTNGVDDISLLEQNGTTVFSADDFSFEFEPNIRIITGWEVFPFSETEITYWGTGFWHDEQRVSSGGFDLSVPIDTLSPEFTNASFASVSYSSRAHSAELNQIWEHAPGWRVLAGLRYFNLYEVYDVDVSNVLFEGDHRIQVDNHLLGMQVGFIHDWQPRERLRWTVQGKTALMFDMVNRKGRFSSSLDTLDPFAFTVSETEAAWLGELGIRANWRWTQQLTWVFGYDLFVVSGVATAPTQFNSGGSPVGPLDVDSTVFYHGAMFGLEYRPY